MSILSLLFGFISFLLLALDLVNLIQIVVLVLIHISVIHVVSLFLIVRINLCIAKLLLFSDIFISVDSIDSFAAGDWQ